MAAQYLFNGPASTGDLSPVLSGRDISVTSLLLGGTSGRVLNVTNLGPGNVSGWVPAGKWIRIRTANVTGSPAYTFVGSQEVLQ